MGKYEDKLKCAFITAVCCAAWGGIAGMLGLPGWAGFAGCTAYFAAPGKGLKSVPATLACVGSGILYALISIYVGGFFTGGTVAFLFTLATTFLMCAGGCTKILSFVPGAFIGSFSTFAADGNIRAVIAIVIGVFLGYACDTIGRLTIEK